MITPELITETWQFMMLNPQVNASKIKKWKVPFIQNAFAASTSGWRMEWDSVDLRANMLKPKRLRLDYAAWLNDKGTAAKNSSEMVEAGLPILARSMMSIVNGCLNSQNLALLSCFVFWDALMGIYRGDTSHIFRQALMPLGFNASGLSDKEILDNVYSGKKNIDVSDMELSDIARVQHLVRSNPPPLVESDLGRHIEEFFYGFARSTEFPDGKKLRDSVLSYLTTRSAGQAHPGSGVITYKTATGEEVTQVMTFLDKITAWFNSYEAYFSREAFDAQLTVVDIGLMFVRNVQGPK
jgi:hypothetical protein